MVLACLCLIASIVSETVTSVVTHIIGGGGRGHVVGNGGKKVLGKGRAVNRRNGDKFYSIMYDFARIKADRGES